MAYTSKYAQERLAKYGGSPGTTEGDPKKKSPAKQKIKTIKRGKHKGHTKEVFKKGEEGYAGKGRGVVIKNKDNVVVETRGKGFKIQ